MSRISHRFRCGQLLAAGLLMILMASCIPMTSSNALVCQTESGASSNVREIYGTWKMVRGYVDGNRTEEELEHDYDVLVVQTGGGICRIGYVAQSPIETVMLGTYDHNVSTKQLGIVLSVPDEVEVTAKYSFSGSCADPRMTLRYNNGAVETYKFRSKSVGDGCPF